jgi:DNA-binding protein H-NS
MSEFLDILTHGRRLKAATKDLTVSQLHDVAEKLAKVITDREHEEAAELQAQAAKLAKIEELRRAMAAADITEADLLGGSATAPVKVKAKRAPKPARYAIVDSAGQRITWTGQGRMPKVLAQAIAKGKSIDDFKI